MRIGDGRYMAMLRARTLNLLTFAVLALAGSGVSAQGLIFNLPEDGKMVEYEGTLTQGTSADDESPLSWTCQLTIKSVGRENAEFQGESQPCRWLEIKVLTGNLWCFPLAAQNKKWEYGHRALPTVPITWACLL